MLIGEDAPALCSALSGSAPVTMATSFEEAFAAALTQARPGDTVLLSPACASFDMFSGYQERGAAFRALVKAWVEAQS